MDSPSVLDALSKERNISLEEMYISYPRSATILAAACAVIFSVVGVTGKSTTPMVTEGCRAAPFLHIDSESPSTTIHLPCFQGGGSYGEGTPQSSYLLH
uniref:Uncharacterized protein n=1 Tax=Timema douglasi TaxID=61478 RepID=A0A7R8ZDJ4_TIMDO|nr:unnamed protein product [Timema douglasi]